MSHSRRSRRRLAKRKRELVEPTPLWRRLTAPTLGVEGMAVSAGVYFAAVTNVTFWRFLAGQGAFTGGLGALMAIAVFFTVAVAHVVPICTLVPQAGSRWVLGTLCVAAATTNTWLSQAEEPVVHAITTGAGLPLGRMAADVLASPSAWGLIGLQIALPLALLARVTFPRRHWQEAAVMRGGVILLSLAILAISAALVTTHAYGSFLREHRPARYLVTPANVMTCRAEPRSAARSGRDRPHGGPAWVRS